MSSRKLLALIAQAPILAQGPGEYLDYGKSGVSTSTFWIDAHLVLNEKHILVYSSGQIKYVIPLESIHVVYLQKAMLECGRENALLLAADHLNHLFSFPNPQVYRKWTLRLNTLQVSLKSKLMEQAKHLQKLESSELICIEKRVYFLDNTNAKNNWERVWMVLRGLQVDLYTDNDGERKHLKSFLTINVQSTLIGATSYSKRAQRFLNDITKLPTEYFLCIGLRLLPNIKRCCFTEFSMRNCNDCYKNNIELYICSDTEEDQQDLELAFRINGRGGAPPLAGCNVYASVLRPEIVEQPKKFVEYVINVRTTIPSSANDLEGGQDYSARKASVLGKSWEVRRRLTSFRRLHEALREVVPHLDDNLPSLPSRGIRRNFNSKHLADRKNMVEQYLREALKYRTIMNSAEMQIFLLESDNDAASFAAANSLAKLRTAPDTLLKKINKTVIRAVSSRSIQLSSTTGGGGLLEEVVEVESIEEEEEELVHTFGDRDIEDCYGNGADGGTRTATNHRRCTLC